MNELGKEGVDRPLDLGELIDTLARHGVDYVVIGGVATQVHGHRRTTMDLDLTPDPSPENLRRLAAALAELEARPRDSGSEKAEIPASDPERLAIAAIVPPLLTRHGQIHILKEPKGARGFDEMRERALALGWRQMDRFHANAAGRRLKGQAPWRLVQLGDQLLGAWENGGHCC